MTDEAKRLEALRKFIVAATDIFIKFGQCGKINESGVEELDVEQTAKLKGIFGTLRARAEREANIRALASVAVLARHESLKHRFWVSEEFRDYSEGLLAISWLERHDVLDRVPIESAQRFVRYH